MPHLCWVPFLSLVYKAGSWLWPLSKPCERGSLCLKLHRICTIPGSLENFLRLPKVLRCFLSWWHTYWAADQSQQHGQHPEWEGEQERKEVLLQNEDKSPTTPTLCPHFDIPPATICEKLNAEREDGEKAHQPFLSPPPKHHPCCCLCLPTPGTKAPIRLIILPLRMFPLRGSLGLAAWQQAAREPGGHLLLQCQCYFRGVRLLGRSF